MGNCESLIVIGVLIIGLFGKWKKTVWHLGLSRDLYTVRPVPFAESLRLRGSIDTTKALNQLPTHEVRSVKPCEGGDIRNTHTLA